MTLITPPPPEGPSQRRFRPTGEETPARRPRKITVDIDDQLLEAVRDAVVHLSGPPHRLTLRSLVEQALRHELERLSEDELHGEPFPPRTQELRAGRPLK